MHEISRYQYCVIEEVDEIEGTINLFSGAGRVDFMTVSDW